VATFAGEVIAGAFAILGGERSRSPQRKNPLKNSHSRLFPHIPDGFPMFPTDSPYSRDISKPSIHNKKIYGLGVDTLCSEPFSQVTQLYITIK
jgi:hypothetical protein